jgi:hypothetical protein
MFRASLPFNKIYRDQNHVHTNEIIKAFEFLYKNENSLPQNLSNDIKTYLVYLWSNNGPYFMTEQSNNKRTPSRLNMKYLTKEVFVLTELNYGEQFNKKILNVFVVIDALTKTAHQFTNNLFFLFKSSIMLNNIEILYNIIRAIRANIFKNLL